MSQATNVEVVREMYEAFNRGDFKRATDLLHPEAELHQNEEMPDPDYAVAKRTMVLSLVRSSAMATRRSHQALRVLPDATRPIALPTPAKLRAGSARLAR